MSRPLTDQERERLRLATEELNAALVAFADAGYQEVILDSMDVTVVGDLGRRLRLVIQATRAVDVLRIG